jgi:hypothetical protein
MMLLSILKCLLLITSGLCCVRLQACRRLQEGF